MNVSPTTANVLIANTTVNIPDGGTVLLGGFKFLAEERTKYGPPVLSKIPYLSRLFRNVGWSRDGSNADLPGDRPRHYGRGGRAHLPGRIAADPGAVAGEIISPLICLRCKCDLVLFVLDFWGEEEDLGADRQRGDCRRPIFPFHIGRQVHPYSDGPGDFLWGTRQSAFLSSTNRGLISLVLPVHFLMLRLGPCSIL